MFAVISPVEIDTKTIGSVGSLIGAALESAGHYLQSEVLDLFSSGLAESLGAFLYILAAIFGIFLIAVGGNYKHGAWFLIGPALFYFIVGVRVESTGPEWNFGGLERDNSQLAGALRGVTPATRTDSEQAFVEGLEDERSSEFSKNARVSWFFAKWNKLSSSIVNNFIAVVNQSNKYRDVQFISKVDRYAKVITAKTDDPDLIQFFHTLVITKCSRLYTLKMDLYNRGLTEAKRTVISEQLLSGLNGKLALTAVNLSSESKYKETLNYLREYFFVDGSLDPRYAKVFSTGEFPISNEELYNGTLSCGQMWQLSIVLFKDNAETLIPKIFIEGIDKIKNEEGKLAIPLNETRNELLNKFRRTSLDPEENGLADGILDSSTPTDQINPDEMAYNTMLNEMAGRMILDELKDASSNIIDLDFEENVLENDKFHEWQVEGTPRLVRFLHGGIEYLGKGDFLTSMLSMPHMQGLALYFLAIVFPFFAFVILIPGRQNGFFLWMGLWFWIKSWDFGFAVVMMISDMLYILLPNGPALSDTDLSDPSLVMKKMLEVDPSYSVYLYYRLVATCLAAVPLMTGVLVQRGGGEIMRAIEQGFKDFGGRIGHSMDQMERAILAGDEAARARTHMINGLQAAQGNILKDNKNILNALQKGLGSAAVNAALAGDSRALTQAITKASVSANTDRALHTAIKMFDAELNMKAYELSNDAVTISSASLSVAGGMFMRHPGRALPFDQLLDTMLESVNTRVGDKFEKAIRANVIEHATSLIGRTKLGESLKLKDGFKDTSVLANVSPVATSLGSVTPVVGGAALYTVTQGSGSQKLEASQEIEGLWSGFRAGAGGNAPGHTPIDPLNFGSQISVPIDSDFETNTHRLHGSNTVEGIPVVSDKQKEELQVKAVKIGTIYKMNAEEMAVYFSTIEHKSGWNSSYADPVLSSTGLFAESPANTIDNYQSLVKNDPNNLLGLTQAEVDRGEFPNRLSEDNALLANAYKITSYRADVERLVEQEMSQLTGEERSNFDVFGARVGYYYALTTQEAQNTYHKSGVQAEIQNHILPLARKYAGQTDQLRDSSQNKEEGDE